MLTIIYVAKQHARAVAKHLGVKEGLIYLPGLPALRYEDSDQEVFFRQRRYFYYLSGLNYEDCIVTYNIKRDGLYVWIPPPRTGRSVIYNGENPSTEEIKAISDCDFVATADHIQDYLSFFTHREKSPIYLLHDYQRPTIAPSIQYHDGTEVMLNPIFDYSMLKPAMDAARVIKSPFEIDQIRKANAITTEAHINVLRAIRDLKNESEIEAIFTGTCISLQAKSQAYGVIAGSGKNASTLHYGANNEPLKGRQLVCLDAGCEWKNYASDVTRTFPISGKWTKEAKEIYDVVAKMQDECIEMVKPGANYRNIQRHAHKVLVAGLLDLGLLHGGTFEEVFRSGVSVAFLPHGLGRKLFPALVILATKGLLDYMGLEVHDMGAGGYLLSGFPNETHAVDQRMGIDNIVQNRRAYRRQPIDPKQIFDEIINSPDASNPSILEENVVITVEPGM